jgi:hypothetical protein
VSFYGVEIHGRIEACPAMFKKKKNEIAYFDGL